MLIHHELCLIHQPYSVHPVIHPLGLVYKYSLQLSMYAFFLEKYGFTPRNLTINHLIIKKWDEEPPVSEPKYKIDFENSKYYVADEILYPVTYMKKEVKSLLQYHKSKQRK